MREPWRSAENFGGDCFEPVIRESGLERARGVRRVERAHAGRPFYLLDLTVRLPIDAFDRNTVVPRHQTVAGVDESRLLRSAAGDVLSPRGRAAFGLATV